MPSRLNIKITCDVESLKITHSAKEDLSFRRFLDIVAFIKTQCEGKSWAPESSILLECEIDDTQLVHTVNDLQSFDRLFPLIGFIKSQYFNNSYSMFNIHTPVFIKQGECAGKFGIIENVYHEFVERSDYELTSLCLQVGDKTIWTPADNVVVADRLMITEQPNGELLGISPEPPIEIKITRRLTDNNDYYVDVAGQKGIWAAGSSEATAIGDLILSHYEYFGLQITRENLEKTETPEDRILFSVDKAIEKVDTIVTELNSYSMASKNTVANEIETTPAEPDPAGQNGLIGRSVELLPTGKPTKMMKNLIGKTLVIKNVINDEFAVQYKDEAVLWCDRRLFKILPESGEAPQSVALPFPPQPRTQIAENTPQEPQDDPLKENETDWPDEQLEVIMKCNDAKEAITAYRKAFPDSNRSYQSIQITYTLGKKKEKLIALAKVPEEEWPADQNEFLKQCFKREDVLKAYREKFPDSTRKDYPILQQWAILTRNMKERIDQERQPMQRTMFSKDQYVKPKEGYMPILPGKGKVKRVNLKSGDILVEFSNGMEWVKGSNYELVEIQPDGSEKS